MSRVRVLVVDDHPVVRAGVAALLANREELQVVGEAADGEQALAQVVQLRPAVVLTDLRLGDGLDGVGVTRRIAELEHPAAVIILTTYDHDADIVRAVEAGAVGYLLKDADPDEIVAAVVRAAAGETVLSSSMSQRVIESMRHRRSGLSDREREVLQLVADGLSNHAIAKTLFLSEATVKTHLNRAFGKLGVDSRTGAVAAARAAGLID